MSDAFIFSHLEAYGRVFGTLLCGLDIRALLARSVPAVRYEPLRLAVGLPA